MTVTKSPLDGLTTMTGEPLIAALNALDEKLPDGAYKAVKMGNRTFTDISPAYSTEEIANHFGPLGIGWGYDIEDEHVTQHKRALKDRQGNPTGEYAPFIGVTLRIKLWFAYYDGDKLCRVEWQSYGGNANSASGADEHFCWQGALTNAIGKGWSLEGFQRTIYKGEDFQLEEPKANPLKADWEKVKKAYKGHTDRRASVLEYLGKPASEDEALAAFCALGEAERVAVWTLANGGEVS